MWVHSIVFAVLMSFMECEYYQGEYVSTYPSPETYVFDYTGGICSQIYGPDEVVTPFSCRWLNISKIACIWFTKHNDYNLFQIKTPTNETIQFIHYSDQGKTVPKGCFNVINRNNKTNVVCQKSIDKYSIGITTPDNNSMLFSSPFCSTTISSYSLKDASEFASNYKFNPEERSCYKIYNVGEKPSPYTCMKDSISEACAYQYNTSCLGITTSKNETLLLDCNNGSPTGCFQVIDADGKNHEICQEILEDRCVSLVMPSKLSVLLECHFCYRYGYQISYYPTMQQNQRHFIKQWFKEDNLGFKSYLSRTEFVVFKSNQMILLSTCMEEETKVYPFWLPNTNCWGVVLPNNETIELECIGIERKSGCFNISSGNEKKEEICLKIIEEKCVGLKTTDYHLIMDCYMNTKCSAEFEEDIKDQYKQITADTYLLFPFINNCYEIFYDEPSDYSCLLPTNVSNYVCMDIMFDGEEYCYGFKTPRNEFIGFLCANNSSTMLTLEYLMNMKNCFKVKHEDKTLEHVCQRKIGNYSIGLTTSKNSSVILVSYFCPEYLLQSEIEEFKQFFNKFHFNPDIRTCYKVYEENEIITPYTCLNNNIYDACVQNLPNHNNCTGIITQNKEIVVLSCEEESNLQNGCFEIYSSTGEKHVSCQERLEDRCVGFKTPSNLSVLLECIFCKSQTGGYLPKYDDENRLNFRNFVTTTFSYFKNGNYSFIIDSPCHAYRPNRSITHGNCKSGEKTYYVHKLQGHFNCLGITTTGMETIIFDCPNNATYKTEGCFEVFSPKYGPNKTIVSKEEVVQTVCVQLLDERCIGIKTPENWTVPLACANMNGDQCWLVN